MHDEKFANVEFFLLKINNFNKVLQVCECIAYICTGNVLF